MELKEGLNLKMNYKIKDLMWEFTLSCNKSCKFCGSKEIINTIKSLSLIDKKKIVDQICQINNLNILTLTGGEPAYDNDFQEIINYIFNSNPTLKVRVLTNGLLIDKIINKEIIIPTGMNFGIGYSINDNIIQLSETMNKLYQSGISKEQVTMVTNFGKHNKDNVLTLKSLSALFGLWQIQLTIDDELMLNENEIKELYENIQKLNSFKPDVILADNFNTCDCQAGISSCSITADGYLVPCLSYRTWRKTMDFQGNIINGNETLLDIWNNKFQRYRENSKCACCKDITKILSIFSSINNKINKINNQNDNNIFKIDPKFNRNTITVYSVIIDEDKSKIWNQNLVAYATMNINDIITTNSSITNNNKKEINNDNND